MKVDLRGMWGSWRSDASPMTFSLLVHHRPTATTVAAVASHYPAVGSVVPWVSSDGGVLTQAVGDPAIGADGLAAIRTRSSGEVLTHLLAVHGQPDNRQLAVLTQADSAAHTGRSTMRHSGHERFDTGELHGVCMGNILTSPRVWHRMVEHLTERPVDDLAQLAAHALVAGHRAGGDLRGQIAVALNVAEPERPGWQVRLDDDVDPVERLPRLVDRARAYQLYADATAQWDAPDQAVALLERAHALDPRNPEVGAVLAAAQARAGQAAASHRTLSQLNSLAAGELLTRIHDSGWLEVPASVRSRLCELCGVGGSC